MVVTAAPMKPVDVNRLSEAQLDWLIHVGQGGDPNDVPPAYTTTPFLMHQIIRSERIETVSGRHDRSRWGASVGVYDFEGDNELIAAAKAYAAWRHRMSNNEMLMVPEHLQ